MITRSSPSSDNVCRLSADLTATWRAEGTIAVVVLRGEADLSARDCLSELVCQAVASTSGDVVIDLAEATFIDSSFIRSLSAGQQMLDHTGRRLSFRSPSQWPPGYSTCLA